MNWNTIQTEAINPATVHIDTLSTIDMVTLINAEDKKVADAVEAELPHIAQAVDIIAAQMKKGGRLVYSGCGTSGRLGVLDAVECPPTYSTEPEQVVGLIAGGYHLPELSLANLHPDGRPVWPFMFITVACGAISGFHGTQSPMMARCLRTEKDGRRVFYGAMISESVIALVWAAAGVAFYGATGGLQAALAQLGQSGVVYEISVTLLGVFGGALAVIGVVVCPVSSGDTAFRSARLIIADWFHIDQSDFKKRLAVTIPLLAAGALLTQVDFNVVWRYFSWSNQTLAMITLWAAAMYLVRHGEKRWHSLLCALPATFMSGVSCTYILMAEEGFRLSAGVAYPVGAAFALACAALYAVKEAKRSENRI